MLLDNFSSCSTEFYWHYLLMVQFFICCLVFWSPASSPKMPWGFCWTTYVATKLPAWKQPTVSRTMLLKLAVVLDQCLLSFSVCQKLEYTWVNSHIKQQWISCSYHLKRQKKKNVENLVLPSETTIITQNAVTSLCQSTGSRKSTTKILKINGRYCSNKHLGSLHKTKCNTCQNREGSLNSYDCLPSLLHTLRCIFSFYPKVSISFFWK